MSLCTTDLSATNLAQSIVSNQVPKTGTVIPNRIFVGGIATQTTDLELKEFFSGFGAVKDTKIICDRAGVSKGYGFVTFETQEDAEKIINKESENLIFKDRKLNIGPAVRKQQAFPRLVDGYPAVSGAPAMFLTTNPYGYATTGGLAMVPSDSYQQALQQQVQPQVGTGGYSNMIIPAQVPALYMQQPTYPYSTTPVQAQVATALQYPNASQQWLSTRCYQPSSVTAVSTANIYPDMMCTPPATTPGVTPQFLELSEGTMQENNVNDTEQRCNSVVTSADGIPINNCQSATSLISSMQPGRAVHQPHTFHGAASVSPQPPPVKRMAPAPTHYPVGCFSAPLATTTFKPTMLPNGRGPAGITYIPHDMRGKYEQDMRLAASIAPPTPPATPAAANGI